MRASSTQTEVLILLLFESGLLYCALWVSDASQPFIGLTLQLTAQVVLVSANGLQIGTGAFGLPKYNFLRSIQILKMSGLIDIIVRI